MGNVDTMIMDLVNNLQKEIVYIKQNMTNNEQLRAEQSKQIVVTQQRNTETLSSHQSDIVSLKNEVKFLRQNDKENKSKKDNIYDTIIDLRRDLESLKKEVLNIQSMKLHRHRRSSSNVKMKFGQEKKEKVNPFREWLRSEEIGMEEYFPLFVSEGIDSLAVASF